MAKGDWERVTGTSYLPEQFLLCVTKEHECEVVVAAMDGPIQKEADHATQSSIHYGLGIEVAGKGGGGGVRRGGAGRGGWKCR